MTHDIYETASATPNFQTELAAQLADLIPEAIADGKLDVEKLKELLGSDVADSSERFGLFWPGKKRALRAAQEPTTATLNPDFENSKDWETTQNIFIEGDNLEVLKVLQKHYHNKVKLIYIDPPYNTGKDFVYPDNFKEGLDTYLEWTRQVNEEGKKVSTNSEAEGRYHSNWLNMMYPRLKLARNLMTDDGVIFISIDDNEVANLRRLCDEIFGENNFIADAIWRSKDNSNNDAKRFSLDHNHTLIYARSSQWVPARISDENKQGHFKNPDADPRGPYFDGNPLNSPNYRENLTYILTSPQGIGIDPPKNGWRWSKEAMQEKIASGEIRFTPDGKSIRRRTYLWDTKGLPPSSLWIDLDRTGHNRQAKYELMRLMPEDVFDTPKPVKLLKYILQLASVGPDAIVLDFFAGSSTTAHAVMQLNAEDGGRRRFIMTQLPEPTPDKSEAREAGFNTIADISRRRIVLAGETILAESGDQLDTPDAPLDLGFRAFKLADTNFSKWKVSSDVEENALQHHLLSLRDSATDDATADVLLTEILLKQGYSLTEAVSAAEVAGLEVRIVRDPDGDVGVLAYLNEHVKPTLDQLRDFVNESPTRIIILEDAFHGDDELKTNLAQLAKSKGIEVWTA
ncbi:site-specific DNA-methyltransferase [Cryobacterium sp. HLT2-28]|uniref:site-specific DNA-methyltransferase n=1 Tax=Cryobacterium sp. HLT2-28 TaxID=1259146 RepID=UPI00106DC89B|nr:site-specific DNA-methyltransferase [Cryobacterium sp. HLT2-28]TFB93202.1 site-specific DNA-methyltransferase [Cryobacterium sp. HLT2-28]